MEYANFNIHKLKPYENDPRNEGVIYTQKFFELPEVVKVSESELKRAFKNDKNFRKFMKDRFGIILPKEHI